MPGRVVPLATTARLLGQALRRSSPSPIRLLEVETPDHGPTGGPKPGDGGPARATPELED
jgi:hypothetical protein